jgi:rubrerythrin
MPDDNLNDQPLIRDLIARELETINNYADLMRRSESEEARLFFKHVLDEENEHITEGVEILRQLDPEQAAILDKGGHARSPKPENISIPVVTRSSEMREKSLPPEIRNEFTVGSLKGLPQS